MPDGSLDWRVCHHNKYAACSSAHEGADQDISHAIADSTATKAVAGAYLAQEAVEESAEAYAGFWALDVVSRPVRIEAELVRLSPLTTVWKTSDSGLSDVSLFRVIRKVRSDELNRQLDQATDYAVKDVASNFSDALENIKP